MSASRLYDTAAADAYEARASAAFPGREGFFRVVAASLADLAPGARILVVGCGTGSELLAIGNALPTATFLAVDPVDAMLEHCRRRLEATGLAERVELRCCAFPHASVEGGFDAATALFVNQHLASEAEVLAFFSGLERRLRPGGRLLAADMFLPDGRDRAAAQRLWVRQAQASGLDEAFVTGALEAFGKAVRLRRARDLRRLQRQAGFTQPQLLFASLLYALWYSEHPRPRED